MASWCWDNGVFGHRTAEGTTGHKKHVTKKVETWGHGVWTRARWDKEGGWGGGGGTAAPSNNPQLHRASYSHFDRALCRVLFSRQLKFDVTEGYQPETATRILLPALLLHANKGLHLCPHLAGRAFPHGNKRFGREW